LPLNSAILATRPLSEAQWRAIGWDGHEILGDFAHAYFYAQRTASGRIAFGGRGIPYRFRLAHRSRWRDAGRHHPPAARHAAAPFSAIAGRGDRPWLVRCAGRAARLVRHGGAGPATRIGWAGAMWGWGFPPATWPGARWPIWRWGGHSALTALPWVNRRVRAWEPEPLRWLAVNGLYAAYRRADRQEEDGRPGTAPLARLADRLVGR
jgi:hypothetical protein